jgi:hypothetical protein
MNTVIENTARLQDEIGDAFHEMSKEESLETTRHIKRNAAKNLQKNYQGEAGLEEFATDIEQGRDARGRFTRGHMFAYEHPTSVLHEIGAPIEPTYSQAKVDGWDRDGFYEALKDCESIVTKKAYLISAINKTVQIRGLE